MSASWKKPSRSLSCNTRRKGQANRNDRRMDQPSLAINLVRSCGGTPDHRIPQEPGQSPLLVVAQRVVQIPHPVIVADEPWRPPRTGPGREEDRDTGCLIHDSAN